MEQHPIQHLSPVVAEGPSGSADPAPEGRDAGQIWNRVLALGIAAGLVPCAILLLSMACDFGREYILVSVLATPFFALSVWLVARNVWFAFCRPVPKSPLNRRRRLLLAAAIPVGFFACALGCMGLSLRGCSRTCASLSLFGIPAAAIGSLVYIIWPRPGVLLLMLLLSMSFLAPNCVCDNVVNDRWIALLGLSPACYSIGVVIALLSISTLHTRQRVGLSATYSWLGVAGCLAFFVCHHFLHYPW